MRGARVVLPTKNYPLMFLGSEPLFKAWDEMNFAPAAETRNNITFLLMRLNLQPDAESRPGSLRQGSNSRIYPYNAPDFPSFLFSRYTLSYYSSSHKGDNSMKDLVAHIARELVDKPEEVSVVEVEGNHTAVLELKVAKDDLGKVIGKKGRIAQAIRTIVSSVAAKEKKRTVLEILD